MPCYLENLEVGWMGDRSMCPCSRLLCTLVFSLSVALPLAAPQAEMAIGKGLAFFLLMVQTPAWVVADRGVVSVS